jgi:hypothetical protein
MRHAILRAAASAVFAMCWAAPLLADVTIKQAIDGKVLGFSGKGTSTTYIKGNRMRVETVLGDRTQIMIFDVDAQKLYMVDPRKKQVDAWDMAAFAAQMEKSVDLQSAKGAIKPNGKSKQIGGQTAAGYDMTMSMNAAMAGSKDLNMTVTMQGPAWIVKGAPGSADFSRFYKAAAAKGFIFGNPDAAKAQPGQAKALAEMYRQFADIGGIPYETVMDIKMSGEGPMAMVARMGNATMTQVVESVDTAALADDLFVPPAGFKINQKK